MPEYTVTRDNHIKGGPEIVTCDEEAVLKAQEMVDGHDMDQRRRASCHGRSAGGPRTETHFRQPAPPGGAPEARNLLPTYLN